MAECANALASLAPPGTRNWRASVTQAGAILLLHHVPLQISLALIRLDADQREEPHPGFSKFVKKIVALNDLLTFIPDWLDLHWCKVSQHPEAKLSIGRCQGQSYDWQVWVMGTSVAQLTHREVLLRLMGAEEAV